MTKPKAKTADNVVAGEFEPKFSKTKQAAKSLTKKSSGGKGKSHRAPGAIATRDPDPFMLGPTGLVVKGNPTFEQYAGYFTKLTQMGSSVAWAIGDMLLYGETRADWTEMYAQAVDETQKSIDSLMSMRNVSKKYAEERRRPLLSWSHHRVLAPMPELDQDKWLDICEKEGLSVKQLQERLKDAKDVGSPALPFAGDTNEIVTVVFDATTHEIASVWKTEGLANREVARLNREADAKVFEAKPYKVQGPADIDGDTPSEDGDGGEPGEF